MTSSMTSNVEVKTW